MSAELALTAGDLTVEFDGAGECDDLTADEAEVVTSRIRRWVNDFPVDDVVLAFRGRVWIALAYASWSEWCECELGGLRLPAPKRRAVAAGLASQGISNVAIGSALGVTEGTVRNDLASQNYEADRKRLGQDGKSYSAPQPKPGASQAESVIDAEIVCRDCDGYGCETCFPADDFPADVIETIAEGDAELADKLSDALGADGSRTAVTPTPIAPQKSRRRPLEEGFFDATMRLKKAVTSLENLGKDDRLPRNKNQVTRYRSDLIRAIDALQRVADQLT